ncbi:hypothetical protein PIB30_027258 [Stylosanthes scabra]|uniref:RRM domain-containing protein n=1 Tax=Stylosanthes scabra TaxID=79078 RepID=A0ABU6WDN0_9FABA|nr:hypothetical protein [Stylosanthes scabra]
MSAEEIRGRVLGGFAHGEREGRVWTHIGPNKGERTSWRDIVIGRRGEQPFWNGKRNGYWNRQPRWKNGNTSKHAKVGIDWRNWKSLEQGSHFVFVDNLPAQITKRGLHSEFGEYGEILDIFISRKVRRGKRLIAKMASYGRKPRRAEVWKWKESLANVYSENHRRQVTVGPSTSQQELLERSIVAECFQPIKFCVVVDAFEGLTKELGKIECRDLGPYRTGNLNGNVEKGVAGDYGVAIAYMDWLTVMCNEIEFEVYVKEFGAKVLSQQVHPEDDIISHELENSFELISPENMEVPVGKEVEVEKSEPALGCVNLTIGYSHCPKKPTTNDSILETESMRNKLSGQDIDEGGYGARYEEGEIEEHMRNKMEKSHAHVENKGQLL